MSLGGDDEQQRAARKRAILNDRAIHASICKVLRIRRVKPQDVEDVMQRVLEAAYKSPSMPLDREQARLWLGGAARNEAADYFTALKAKAETETVLSPRTVDPNGNLPETRTLARTILDHLRARFGHKASWYERSEIGDETFQEIADSENRNVDHVRKEVSMMRRAAMIAVGSIVLAVLAFALAHHFTPGVPQDQQIAHPTRQRAPEVIAPKPVPSASIDVDADPVLLRARARREYELGQFDRVVGDLQRAEALDPAGVTPELKKMSDRAWAHLANSKPQ